MTFICGSEPYPPEQQRYRHSFSLHPGERQEGESGKSFGRRLEKDVATLLERAPSYELKLEIVDELADAYMRGISFRPISLPTNRFSLVDQLTEGLYDLGTIVTREIQKQGVPPGKLDISPIGPALIVTREILRKVIAGENVNKYVQ